MACGTQLLQWEALWHWFQNREQVVGPVIRQCVPAPYAKLHTLRKIRLHYADALRKIYAIITQIKLRTYYANISILRKYITQILRRYYADITQTNYAFITHFTQNYANKLRIYYANKLRNFYAFYADITQINYAILRKTITQIITHFTQSLRKYITQIWLRNSPKFYYADYANTIFITHHYAMGNLLMILSLALAWLAPNDYPAT